ncbi:MAG TPA: cytochrome C oxidase subunit IV family protein [Solimonas sp.]
MSAYLRNPLVLVWAFLTASTVVSWWMSHDAEITHQFEATITAGVLLIAALKTKFVILYFMEVRHAPAWLKRTMDAWLILLFGLLFGFYFMSI